MDRLLGGGFPRGRLSEIAGPPSSGRTSLALSLLLDGFEELPRYAGALLAFTLIGLVLHLLIFWRAGLYGRYWRYASVDEIAKAIESFKAELAGKTRDIG